VVLAIVTIGLDAGIISEQSLAKFPDIDIDRK
jgi:hypothetical protein